MSMYRTVSQRRGMRGDPGIFGSIGKLAGGIIKAIPGVGNVVSVIGGVAGALGGLSKRSPAVAVNRVGIQEAGVASAIPPILRGIGSRVLPKIGPIATGIGLGGLAGQAFGGGGRRRYRRMNPTNPKALRRAIRRVQRFGEFARAAGYSRPPRLLKGVGFPKKKR